MKKETTSGKVLVKQVRSLAGRDQVTINTMKALGLTRIGTKREFNLSPSIIGMIKRVEHLVDVSRI